MNKTFVVLICVFFIFSLAHAEKRKEVINILSWWGYLDDKIADTAEKKCGVKISYDQYYSNDEFLRRWKSQQEDYQVIIFSESIYNVIRDKLPRIDNTTLQNNVYEYNKTVKNHYLKLNYPNSVIYFAHSMVGFLWNPEKIYISANDSIYSIFKKAKNNYVVMIDDPVELEKLIRAILDSNENKSTKKDILTINNFYQIISGANVYITINYSQIYTKPDFAFSFTWSGQAMTDITKSNKKYKFLIHPKLSYISSDLIAQTSNTTGSRCVASFLSSKQTMEILQNKDYYFTPYTDYTNVSNITFKQLYKEFVSLLPEISWLNPVDKNDFYKINKSWQLVKLSLNARSGEEKIFNTKEALQ